MLLKLENVQRALGVLKKYSRVVLVTSAEARILGCVCQLLEAEVCAGLTERGGKDGGSCPEIVIVVYTYILNFCFLNN